jgi:phosphatidylinositol glycan class B
MNQSGPGRDWRYAVVIAAILAVAIALRLAFYSPWDQHHADEFYQYLEQANRLVTGYGLVPWESRYGIRNALIPQFLSAPMWLGNLISPTGTLPIHLARLSFAALCLLALAGAWGLGAVQSRRHALVALFIAAIWFDSVQFSVLLLSETIATAVIACGAALLLAERTGRRQLWLAGFLLVLGLLLRFQFAPFVAALVLASVRLDWRVWRELAIGAAAALVLGGMSDLLDGRVPFLWIINNFQMNIGEGRAAEFGEEGPLYYPEMIFLALGPAIPAILAAAALAGRRYWPVLLAIVVNVAAHMLIGHKEYRFVWLSVFLILVLAGIGSVNVADWLIARRKPGRTAGWAALLVLCAGWFGLSQTVLGEESVTKRLRLKGGAYSMAAHHVAARPEICGISVSEDKSGHLIDAISRRDLPIYVIPQEMADGLSSLPPGIAEAANATIADGDLPFNPEYEIVACHERTDQKACLLIRPGGCDPAAGQDQELQTVMLRAGM